MNRKTTSAFTLVELMIALAVVAVISLVAAPSMIEMSEKNRRESALASLQRTLAGARSEAIARNQAVVVCSSSNGSSCNTSNWDDGWLAYADDDDDGTLDAGEAVLNAQQLSNTLTVRASSSPLRFQPDGSVTDLASFRICGSDADLEEAYTVFVSVTGRARSSYGATSCP